MSLSTNIFTNINIYNLFIYLPVFLATYLPICLFIYASIYLFVFLFIYLPLFCLSLHAYLFIYL